MYTDKIEKITFLYNKINDDFDGMYVFFENIGPIFVPETEINPSLINEYKKQIAEQNRLIDDNYSLKQLLSEGKIEFIDSLDKMKTEQIHIKYEIALNNAKARKAIEQQEASNAVHKGQFLLHSPKTNTKITDMNYSPEELKTRKINKGVLAIAGILTAVVITISGCALFKKDDKNKPTNDTSIVQTINYDTTDFKIIMKNADKTTERYKLFERMDKYSQTTLSSIDAILAETMTYGEYSEEEIIEIFGKEEYNFNEEAYKDFSIKSLDYLVNHGKNPGDKTILIDNTEAKQKYGVYYNMYVDILNNYTLPKYGTSEKYIPTAKFKEAVGIFEKTLRDDLSLIEVAEVEPTFEYKETTNSDMLIASRDLIAAAMIVGGKTTTLTAKEISYIDESNMCSIARDKAADINDTLKYYRISQIENETNEEKVEPLFSEWYKAFDEYVKENNLKDGKLNLDKLEIISEIYVDNQEKRTAIIENGLKNSLDGKTGTYTEKKVTKGTWSGSGNISGFTAKDQKSVEEQKAAIDKALAEETRKNKEAAEKAAKEAIDKIEESDDSYDEAKEEADDYNEDLNHGNGTVGRPGSGSQVIVGEDENGDDIDVPEFDGPILDGNGNPIAKPNKSMSAREKAVDEIINQYQNQTAENENISSIKK